jgi:hypothetical protein
MSLATVIVAGDVDLAVQGYLRVIAVVLHLCTHRQAVTIGAQQAKGTAADAPDRELYDHATAEGRCDLDAARIQRRIQRQVGGIKLMSKASRRSVTEFASVLGAF